MLVLAATTAGMSPAQVVWQRAPLGPSPRLGHRMVWDSARQQIMLANESGDVWHWDGSAWSETFVWAQRPSDFSLAYDLGRRRAVSHSEGLTFEWNGMRWVQRFPASSPPLRNGHRAVYDAARGYVLLFGGQSPLGQHLQDTWTWNGTSWVEQNSSRPPARRDFALAYDAARGRVVLFGGADDAQVFGDTWEWNGSDWIQRFPAAAPLPRSHHAMAYFAARQRVVLYGGGTNDTWEWDGTSWTRRSSPTQPPVWSAHSLAYDSLRQRVVAWQGDGQVWEWDGQDWTLVPSPRPVLRRDAALVFDARRQRSLLFGGSESSTSGGRNDMWEWDGTSWTRLQLPVPLLPRHGHAMVYDAARARVVLFGGAAGASALNDTWEWDGTTWHLQEPAFAPRPRLDHALVWDARRRRVVLFGGRASPATSAAINDTWEWDGADWIQATTPTRPGPRFAAAMAYHAATGKTVLFGGRPDETGHYADTWEWDGSEWLQIFLPFFPAPRGNHTMVYDEARQVTVLFAGQMSATTYADTWEWNGSGWIPRSPATGAYFALANREHSMTYDVAAHHVVVYDDVGDTWSYGPETVASYTPFDEGCAGSAGVPLLGAVPGSLPWVGQSFAIRVQRLPVLQPAVLFFGLSSTTWAGAPLPLPLGFLGWPGCELLVSPDVQVPIAAIGGTATLTVPPLAAQYAGGVYYNQAASLDPATAPGAVVFSNGARATIGGR